MFLAVGIYALFVSTNYWERYYTLVPSAVAIGIAIVPLWASMGNYITRCVGSCRVGGHGGKASWKGLVGGVMIEVVVGDR